MTCPPKSVTYLKQKSTNLIVFIVHKIFNETLSLFTVANPVKPVEYDMGMQQLYCITDIITYTVCKLYSVLLSIMHFGVAFSDQLIRTVLLYVTHVKNLNIH